MNSILPQLRLLMTHGLCGYLHNQKLRKPKLNGLRVGLLSRRDPRKTPVRMKKLKVH